MNITLDKNNLLISFQYNPVIVEIVKKFHSRKFNDKTKDWIVPAIHVKNVVDTLKPIGFNVSQDVEDIYNNAELKKVKIERIKAGKLKDGEKLLLDNTNLPLFNFQRIGTSFLCVTKSALLCDEPGLGKSIQSLAFTLVKKINKTLILCPSTLKFSWHDEIEKWLPNKKVVVISGSKKERDILWSISDANYVIANYELLLRDIDVIKENKWECIIADEATRISNPKAQQSKLIKTIPALYRIALTGTPLNNAIQDIWNIMDFCQPGLLGNYWQFLERYCMKDRFGGIIGYKNVDELKNFIADNMIRRLKQEVLTELPDKMYETIYIDFADEERTIYDAVKKELREELKRYDIERALNDKYLSNLLVKMIRLKQVADSLELVSTNIFSSKLNALKELLADIMHDNDKAIIFTQYSEMADIIVRELAKYKPLLISGKITGLNRENNVNLFQNDDEHKIIVMTEAGGFGLNLQRAKYIIHYDLPWSVSKMEQREGRAHRIGQKSTLTIFTMIVKSTIDEYVLKILHKKQKMSKNILNDKDVIKKVKISIKDIENILS